MPTYEYLCTTCQNLWEEVQKISEPPIEVCPKCGASTAKRQISGGSFILKGGGWYADLYSSSKPGAKAAKDEGASSGGGEASKPTETKESPKAAPAPAAAPKADPAK